MAGAAPRDGRRRLALVLAGRCRSRHPVVPERGAGRSLLRGRSPPSQTRPPRVRRPYYRPEAPVIAAPFPSRGGARNALGLSLLGIRGAGIGAHATSAPTSVTRRAFPR